MELVRSLRQIKNFLFKSHVPAFGLRNAFGSADAQDKNLFCDIVDFLILVYELNVQPLFFEGYQGLFIDLNKCSNLSNAKAHPGHSGESANHNELLFQEVLLVLALL